MYTAPAVEFKVKDPPWVKITEPPDSEMLLRSISAVTLMFPAVLMTKFKDPKLPSNRVFDPSEMGLSTFTSVAALKVSVFEFDAPV